MEGALNFTADGAKTEVTQVRMLSITCSRLFRLFRGKALQFIKSVGQLEPFHYFPFFFFNLVSTAPFSPPLLPVTLVESLLVQTLLSTERSRKDN